MKLSKKGLNKTEVLAGVTTFFTMSYIVIVNPSILASSGTGMTFSGVLTATVLLAFTMTLFMGLYAKLPFAVAPGMGVNAFFAFTLVLSQKIPWQTALAMVFWAGVLFLLVSVTRLRESIVETIPNNLRVASATGIGLFLAFIGLKNSGLVVSDPATLVKVGDLNHQILISFFGLFVMVWMMKRKSPFAFLLGIFFGTLIAWCFGYVKRPEHLFSKPDFESVFLKLDFFGALKLAYVPAILSILFTDLFDSISTFVGVSQATKLVEKNGAPKNLRKGLLVDAFATMTAGILGTSSGTAYIESAAGIEVGGRTGWTSVVTAICFLPCLFVAPLAAMVPDYATAPVLIIVGALMFRTVQELELDTIESAIPAFLTIILIPLTFSITQGILWGFLSHTVLYFLVGRRRDLSLGMLVLAALSAGLLVLL